MLDRQHSQVGAFEGQFGPRVIQVEAVLLSINSLLLFVVVFKITRTSK